MNIYGGDIQFDAKGNIQFEHPENLDYIISRINAAILPSDFSILEEYPGPIDHSIASAKALYEKNDESKNVEGKLNRYQILKLQAKS